MSWTVLSSYAVGEKLKVAKLSSTNTAIGELQTNANATVYDQNCAAGGNTWTSNAARQLFPSSSWPSAGGFTGGTSIAVPTAGAYQATLIMTLSSGSWAAATRYYAEFDDFVGTFAHANAAVGVSENVLCVTGVTRTLAAAGSIFPYRFQNTGSSITLTACRLIIVRIPAQ